MRDVWEEMSIAAQAAIVLFVTGLVIGGIVLGWVDVLGPAFNNADYNNFNTSPQHLQAVAQKAADDCQQLAQTTDPVVYKAIEQDIYQLVSSVDLTKVQMLDTTRQCVNHAISDVTK